MPPRRKQQALPGVVPIERSAVAASDLHWLEVLLKEAGTATHGVESGFLVE